MKIKQSYKKGLGFGLVSGVITTLGLLIGLYSSTESRLVVVAGILSIAIADSMSDALGNHISEEYSGKHSAKYLWDIGFSTFLSKFGFALLFLIPIYLFELERAIFVSVMLGLFLILFFSYRIAINNHDSPFNVVLEHFSVTIIVILTTYLVGHYINMLV